MVTGAFLGGKLPGISWAVTPVPWYVRIVALPVVLGGLLAMLRVDGRAFHVAAAAVLRHRLSSRNLSRLHRRPRLMSVWRPPPIVFVADGSESTLRALRYHGPGMALICCAHDRVEWRRGHHLFGRAKVSVHPVGDAVGGARSRGSAALEIAPGAVLEVSRSPWNDDVHRG
jgi:hypothetical protein